MSAGRYVSELWLTFATENVTLVCEVRFIWPVMIVQTPELVVVHDAEPDVPPLQLPDTVAPLTTA